MRRTLTHGLLASMVVILTAAVSLAQQSTTTSTQTKTFQVISVDGNDLVVKMPEGTRELMVPDDFRFTVDGQQLSVHDLKPGMKGSAIITTKTTVTPVTVTEVKNGTVMQASGPSIIVKTDQGIKMFSQGDVDKRGVKIMRNGAPAGINDFHQGDQITATIITTHPPHVMTEKQVNATLAKASGGAAMAAPTSASQAPAMAAPAGEAPATKHLPKTASLWPTLWFASMLSLGLGIFLTLKRRAIV
jgi:hypothetical protein